MKKSKERNKNKKERKEQSNKWRKERKGMGLKEIWPQFGLTDTIFGESVKPN
jgi:hypothetical protein